MKRIILAFFMVPMLFEIFNFLVSPKKVIPMKPNFNKSIVDRMMYLKSENPNETLILAIFAVPMLFGILNFLVSPPGWIFPVFIALGALALASSLVLLVGNHIKLSALKAQHPTEVIEYNRLQALRAQWWKDNGRRAWF